MTELTAGDRHGADRTEIARPLVFTLGGLVALSAVATDIALPAQPAIARTLGGDAAAAQWVVSTYLAGFALGQVVWGLASDRFGRLPAIRFGLALFLLASIALALAPTMGSFLIFRFCQGIAGGVGPVVARAIVRDIGAGQAGGRLMAMLTSLLGLGPLLAPIFASLVLLVAPWRTLFWLSAAYAAWLLLMQRRHLVETHRTPDPDTLSPARMGRNARRFLTHPRGIFGLLLVALPFGGYLTVVSASSTVLEQVYHVPATLFGWVFAIAAAGFSLGSLISRHLLHRYSNERVLTVGVILLALAGVVLLHGLGLVARPDPISGEARRVRIA
ncbi:MAG: MFS transporter, partial [Alphaproteobacteria bacterium]